MAGRSKLWPVINYVILNLKPVIMHTLFNFSTARPTTLTALQVAVFLLIALGFAWASIVQPVPMAAPGGSPAAQPARGVPSYALSGYRWDKETVSFSITNCPQSLDCEAARGAVREAAAAWSSVAGIQLVEAETGGDIAISWSGSGYGGLHRFDGKGGRVAQTYYPFTSGAIWYDGDIVLDDAETWVVGTPTQAFPHQSHLTTIITHELGHSLGLAHSSNRAALMWPYYNGPRGVTAHDIAGVQALYGPPAAAAQ